MCSPPLITDRFGESTSDSVRWAAQVGGIPLKASNAPPLLITVHWSGTDKWLIWNPAGGWETGRVWKSEAEGAWDRKRERGREMVSERVSERELLFPPNPSYWILAVGNHHSLALCYLGIGYKTLIKAHLPRTHENTACQQHLCDSKMRNFSRSIHFVVDCYKTIVFKSLQLHTHTHCSQEDKNKDVMWHRKQPSWWLSVRYSMCVRVPALSRQKSICDDAAAWARKLFVS